MTGLHPVGDRFPLFCLPACHVVIGSIVAGELDTVKWVWLSVVSCTLFSIGNMLHFHFAHSLGFGLHNIIVELVLIPAEFRMVQFIGLIRCFMFWPTSQKEAYYCLYSFQLSFSNLFAEYQSKAEAALRQLTVVLSCTLHYLKMEPLQRAFQIFPISVSSQAVLQPSYPGTTILKGRS